MPLSSSKSNSRLPSNIPLRTLPDSSSGSRSHDRHSTEESTSFLRAGQGGAGAGSSSFSGYRVDRPASDSEDDSDSWVETGDIGDQIDAEDPLRQRLNDTLDEPALAGLKPRHKHHAPASGFGSRREKKHVRIHDDATYYDQDGSHQLTTVLSKEAIEIPDVVSLPPSKASRFIAAIMPGSSRGFTGKPLM